MSDRVSFNLNQCGCRPCIRRMRIRMKDVFDLFAARVTESGIPEDFPYLELADIESYLADAAGYAQGDPWNYQWTEFLGGLMAPEAFKYKLSEISW